MSYRDDAWQLARALTDLLTADPTPAPLSPQPLTSLQVQAALVCRDTVVGAVRDLTGALLGRTPSPAPADPDLKGRSPAHALHAALRDLPAATGTGLPLTAALAVQAGPPVTGWQRAGRAAALLETYRDEAAALPGPAAWSLARDLATLGSALPDLDLDLATTLTAAAADPTGPATTTLATTPPAAAATLDGPIGALLDGPSHGRLQLAAAALTAHTTDVPAAAAILHGRSRGPIGPVTRLADLPVAGRQLAELLHRRGSRLTVTEVRAAVRAVGYGLGLTARSLTASAPPTSPPTTSPQTTSPPTASPPTASPPTARAAASGTTAGARSDPDLHEAARLLRQAVPDLQQLLHSELATLTPPAPGVLLLSQQIQHRLTAAGGLHDTLTGGGPAGAREALSQALTRWAVTTGPVLEAIQAGLQAAAADRSLLAPRQDTAAGRDAHLLWLPLQHSTDQPHPALHTADRAGAALRQATTTLSGILEPAAASRPTGARRAAADAAGAFGELTAALQSRPTTAWPNPARTAHPALPGASSQPHPLR